MIFQDKSGAGFFEARYKKQPDPWNFVGSEYEQGRYTRIVEALEHRRYHRAFEPGCSIGILTERLAAFCDAVDASDFSATAAQSAAARCAHLPHVHVTCAALTAQTSLAGYDLVVFSEIGYYFSLKDWRAAVAGFVRTLAPGAVLLGSHWLGHSRDHRLTGDQVHEVLRAEPLLQLEHEERHEGFRLDRFTRRP